jgi:hypothetical protein
MREECCFTTLANFNGATLRQGVRRFRPFQPLSVSSVPSVVKSS